MTQVRLLKGPCDPRDVQMAVTADADVLHVRPMPFDCADVYVITERLREKDGSISAATAEYLHTDGARKQTDAYRKALVRVGAGRAFTLKREKRATH